MSDEARRRRERAALMDPSLFQSKARDLLRIGAITPPERRLGVLKRLWVAFNYDDGEYFYWFVEDHRLDHPEPDNFELGYGGTGWDYILVFVPIAIAEIPKAIEEVTQIKADYWWFQP